MKTISKQLQDLFTADQKDRSDGALWEDANFRNEVSKRDKVRKEEVSKYIKNDQLQTAEDYYFSAMIFQHGDSVADFKQAHQLAKTSMNMGYESAKWLYAASLDRLLLHQGRKQRYGTQYRKENNGKWFLPPVDEIISDDERKKYNVLILSDMTKKIKKLNKKDLMI